jgi:hypothetical protein
MPRLPLPTAALSCDVLRFVSAAKTTTRSSDYSWIMPVYMIKTAAFRAFQKDQNTAATPIETTFLIQLGKFMTHLLMS